MAKIHLSLCAATVLALVASSRNARAQTVTVVPQTETEPEPPSPPAPSPPPPPERPNPRGKRWLALDIDQVFSSKSTTTDSDVVSPGVVADAPYSSGPGTLYFASTILAARLHLSHLEVDAEVPFVVTFGGLSGVTQGDLAFAAYYLHDVGRLRLRLGGILSLPTMSSPPGAVPYPINFGTYGTVGADTPLTYRGFDRMWLWANHYFTPIAPSARIASDEESAFQHATEVVVAPLVGIDSGDSVYVAVQASEEIGAHASIFRAGLRLEGAGVFGPGDPSGAISTALFASVGSKLAFGEIGPVLNIRQWQFGFEEPDTHLGLRLRGGFYF